MDDLRKELETTRKDILFQMGLKNPSRDDLSGYYDESTYSEGCNAVDRGELLGRLDMCDFVLDWIENGH